MSGVTRILQSKVAVSKSRGKAFVKELGNALSPKAIADFNGRDAGANKKGK